MKLNLMTRNHPTRHAGHRPSVSTGQLLHQQHKDSVGPRYMLTTTSTLCQVAELLAAEEELEITPQHKMQTISSYHSI